MFLGNKFTQWYFKIVDASRASPREGYVEVHHIVTKSLGGSNTQENPAKLTAREHFICYRLLVKMTDMMTAKSRGMMTREHRLAIVAELLGLNRGQMTEEHRLKISMANRKPKSAETREKMSQVWVNRNQHKVPACT